MVTLTGNCPGEELKNRAIESIRSIGGVKKVIDNITIAPLVLDTDFVLKQKVDSVLAAYATVESQVKNGVVSLRGKIKKDRVQKLLSGLSQLPVSGIENGLHVQ